MSELCNIAIVGATGAVGEAILEQLVGLELPLGEIFPLASASSAGETVMIDKRPAVVGDLAEFDFTTVHLALFAVPSDVSVVHAPRAVESGCRVVDCSSAFRGDSTVPLILVSQDEQGLMDQGIGQHNLIASPGSLAAELGLVLKPVNDEVEITRINVVACMTASDAGKSGIGELATQAAGLLGGKTAEPEVFPHQIAFNVIPQVGDVQDDGLTAVERGTALELKRILGAEAAAIDVSCIQVPIFYGNSMEVLVETRYPLHIEEFEQILRQITGVQLFSGRDKQGLPTPVTDLQNFDKTCVGRVRESRCLENGLNLWITSDNVRKSAAKNAVAIAKLLVESY